VSAVSFGSIILGTTVVALLLSCAPLTYANTPPVTTEVLNVRVGLTPGRTRIVFDLSEPSAYQLTTLDNPARIVLRLPSSTSQFDTRDVSLQGTPIEQIRSEQQPDASLSYEFQVVSKTEPKLFALKPSQGYGSRLVLDMFTASDGQEVTGVAHNAVTGSGLQIASRDSATPNRSHTAYPKNATSEINPVSSRQSGEWSGSVSLQSRLFFNEPAFPQQDDQNVSAALEPEYYRDWDDGGQSFSFRPFYRYDANDSKRTHGDIRELYWRIEHEQLVFKAGLDVVFWGVTESQHLVDIINQTDWVEDIDGEEKLGQPMLNLDYMTDDWGTVQTFILPYFRERTFPGKHGRLRNEPVVDADEALYESGDKQNHVDFALRWSQSVGDWDIGLSHFTGTSRDPLFIPSGTVQNPYLSPLYLQIDQTSLDVQATKGAWLWKLEALYNDNSVEDYYATVGGLEYTHFGVFDSQSDLGWLLEYHYDERDQNTLSNLQKDLYAGVRLTGNDVSSTHILAGVILDVDTHSTIGSVEASRRLGESWTINLEARLFNNIDDTNDHLYSIKEDDYIQLELSRFF